MTGHNHYPSCTCGWCVNYGRARSSRQQFIADLPRRDAILLLERNSARSIGGCYVNPNARCPICGAAVFFYANASGSRIYFDDLGHPWPKHPCTDNSGRRAAFQTTVEGPPVRRPRGLAMELVAAAKTAGMSTPTDAEGWRLLVVLSAERSGDRNAVAAEFLEFAGEQLTFIYFSPLPLVEAGDFVSKRGDVISFLNRVTMAAITIKDGTTIEAGLVEPVTTEGAAAPRPPVIRRPVPPKPKPPRGPADRPVAHYDMTQAEAAHFHSEKISVREMCDRFGPIVKSYARTGTRKPRDVTIRLNGEGYRTATGALWTPRLSHFLLALIFAEAPSREAKKAASEKGPSAPRSSLKRQTETERPSQAELMKKLSALGRVVVKQR